MSSKRCLFIKNFPKSFKHSEIKDFIRHFGAASVDLIGKNNIFAFAHFQNEVDTEIALRRLHEFEVLDKRLKAFYKNDDQFIPVAEQLESQNVQEKNNEPKICDFVKNLLVNFNQLPNPNLKYKYPKANREIIESISMALESIPKFYVQVLHLMNKMNLPPPFNPKKINQNNEPKFREFGIQTDDISWKSLLREHNESEIESDDDKEQPPKINSSKRKMVIENEGAKRLKMMTKTKIDQSVVVVRGPHSKIEEVFERPPSQLKPFKIMPLEKTELVLKEFPIRNNVTIDSIKILTNEEMVQNRLKPNEMAEHKLFSNYSPGDKSNKLYIKNMQNNITENELKAIFYRYIEKSPDEIQIKHFKEGKLKNQAFISFSTENLNIVEQARHDTNGFILRNRPLIVVFAKTKGN